MPRSDTSEAAKKFVEKWSAVDLPERSASHEHFTDLCRLIGQPTPADADPTGEDYCFVKAVKVTQAALNSPVTGAIAGSTSWSAPGRDSCAARIGRISEPKVKAPLSIL